MLKKVISSIVAKKIRNRLNQQTLNEEEINEILVEIRKILLDADVNISVTKKFLTDIKTKLLGQTIQPGIDIQKYLLNEIKKEFVKILDNGDTAIDLNGNPAVIMVIGLQGTGKTTTVAKLANHFKKNNKKPLTVGLDIYRPAAINQLKILSESIGIDFFEKGTQDPSITAEEAINFAKQNKNDVVILDTAGRLQTDETLMKELVSIKKKTNPKEILLVIDALTGQEVVEIAKEFDKQLNVTGILITKLDSDARAGAIFSIASVIAKPVKFTGNGEKINQLEKFYPERIANRILGLGDIMTLAEKAVEAVDEKTAMKSFQKMLSGHMDLEDLMIQISSMNKMGNLSSIATMLPNVPGLNSDKIEETEEKIFLWKVMLSSMTLQERKNPKLIVRDPSRRQRIAKGSGRKIDELNKLLKTWETSKKKLEQMGNMLKMGKNPFEGIF